MHLFLTHPYRSTFYIIYSVCFIFLILPTLNLRAQAPIDSSVQITIEIQVIRLASQGFESGPSRSLASYSFFLDELIPNNRLQANTEGQNCLVEGINGEFWQNPAIPLKSFTKTMNKGQSSFDLYFKTHNERKGGSDLCSENNDGVTGDKYETSSQYTFQLENFEPGVFSNPIQLINRSSSSRYAEALIQIRYRIPPPSMLALPVQLFCVDKPFHIQTGLPALPQDKLNNISYQLEIAFLSEASQSENPEKELCYLICEEQFGQSSGQDRPDRLKACQGTCDTLHPPILEYIWHPIFSSSDGHFRIDPRQDFFLDTLRQNTSLIFRVKAVSPGLSSLYTYSNVIDFSPSVPQVWGYTKTQSCPNVDNAQIKLNQFSYPPLSNSLAYSFYLLSDSSESSPFGQLPILSGITHAPDWEINNIPPGDYQLALFYEEDNLGLCPSSITVQIEAISNLEISPSFLTRLSSCPGASDAQITVQGMGGKPPYTYQLLDEHSQILFQNDHGSFQDLSPGSYQILIRDSCNQSIYKTVDIPSISLPMVQIEAQNPMCLSPGNGKIKLKLTGGSGTVSAQLYKADSLWREVLGTHTDSLNFNQIPHGEYSILLWDYHRPTCDTIQQTIRLTKPSPLLFDRVTAQNPDCFQNQNGEITIYAQEGTGKIAYKLLDMQTLSILESENGTFTELAAGNYLPFLSPDREGCLDAYYYPDTISLFHPEALSITLNAHNISCNLAENGTIVPQISGGLPPYDLNWEKLSPLGWLSLSNQDTTLSSLGPGAYRLKVSDQNNCSVLSPVQELSEPSPLEIESIDFHRDDCSELFTQLKPQARGGSPPYRYFIRAIGSNEFQVFKPEDSLSNGSYVLSILDAQNCQSTYPQVIEINAQQLFFDLKIDSTCRGKATGSLSVSPSGGKPPYEYSLDGGANFQSDSLFDKLSAGDYSLLIKDQFDCLAHGNIYIPERSLDPEANFLISTVNYSQDTLALIEISQPRPDSLYWVLAPGLLLLDQNPEHTLISVQAPGNYTISLHARFQHCWHETQKSLLINPFDSSRAHHNPYGPEPIIKNFGIYPNPNPGTFRCTLELNRKEEVNIRIRHLTGKMIYQNKWAARELLDEKISLPGAELGSYLLEVITEHEFLVQRFVIQ